MTTTADRLYVWGMRTLLVLMLIATLFPLYWMVRTALTVPSSIVSDPTSLLPPSFTWGNFARVLGIVDTETAVELGGSGQAFQFFRYLLNTIVVAALITVGQVLFSSLAAYAFARLKFPGRDTLFTIYLAALMIPVIITVIPNYLLVRSFGWINTYQGIVAPFFLMTPFAVFFMRQFFLGIHRELEESALLDGAGRLRILWRIILPISKSPMVIVALITFTNSWNEYLWMLIVGRDHAVRVLTVAMGVFQAQTPQGAPDWGGLMSGAVLSALPVLVLFMFTGRHLVNSIGHTGIK